jgi:hypothetical protein
LVESNKLDYSIGIAPRKYPLKIGGWGTSLVTAPELDSYRGAGERGWQRDEGAGRNQRGFSLALFVGRKEGRRIAAPPRTSFRTNGACFNCCQQANALIDLGFTRPQLDR